MLSLDFALLRHVARTTPVVLEYELAPRLQRFGATL